MRLTSDFFVSALLRKAQSAGAYAALLRRGQEGGAIFIAVDQGADQFVFYAPAPQSLYAAKNDIEEIDAKERDERRFIRAHSVPFLNREAIDQRLAREVKFDPDCWLVEIEDRAARPFVEIVEG